MNTLREVRLWHWRKVLSHRKTAQNFEQAQRDWEARWPGKSNQYSAQRARAAHREANRHLGAVQALNDLFPLGDTAEQDALCEDAAKRAAGIGVKLLEQL